MSQKVVPLLKAINKEIPWQVVLMGIICLTVSIAATSAMPAFSSTFIFDFLIRRVLVGFIIALATFLVCSFAYIMVVEKIISLFKKIKANYDQESLEIKRKILDEVIDEEILK